MLVAEKIHTISCGELWKTYYIFWWRSWYDEARNIIKLKHYLHSPLEKSLMERV